MLAEIHEAKMMRRFVGSRLTARSVMMKAPTDSGGAHRITEAGRDEDHRAVWPGGDVCSHVERMEPEALGEVQPLTPASKGGRIAMRSGDSTHRTPDST